MNLAEITFALLGIIIIFFRKALVKYMVDVNTTYWKRNTNAINRIIFHVAVIIVGAALMYPLALKLIYTIIKK
jgi:hypothetical protein